MSPRVNTFLKFFAIAGALLWLGYESSGFFLDRPPGDGAYIAGNNLFKDGSYQRAAESYEVALDEDRDHLPALRGLANALIQLQRYQEAITVIERAIALDPDFGGHFAARGIANDHLGNYREAMADYETALRLDEQIDDGMLWLDRLLYNVQEAPPTVADRLAYLKAEMKKPESERVLSIPDVDTRQRPYEQ